MDIEQSELRVARYERDGATMIELAGKLNRATVESLRVALAAIDIAVGASVRMDLKGLTFVDSSGMALIVDSCREIRAGGGTFSADGNPELLRGAIDVAGLLEYLRIEGGFLHNHRALG